MLIHAPNIWFRIAMRMYSMELSFVSYIQFVTAFVDVFGTLS